MELLVGKWIVIDPEPYHSIERIQCLFVVSETNKTVTAQIEKISFGTYRIRKSQVIKIINEDEVYPIRTHAKNVQNGFHVKRKKLIDEYSLKMLSFPGHVPKEG